MNESDIASALEALALQDEDLAQALALIGPPAPRRRENSLETLLSIVVSQQISTHAAAAIMARVKRMLPIVNGHTLLALEDDALREAGLSWRKVGYAKGLAQAEVDGDLKLQDFAAQSDDEIISTITALKGFGRWSAEIYLMFALKRADVFPADDLALLVALGKLKGLSDKPTPAQARQLVAHWAPYRSIGSLFLWHYYRGAPG